MIADVTEIFRGAGFAVFARRDRAGGGGARAAGARARSAGRAASSTRWWPRAEPGRARARLHPVRAEARSPRGRSPSSSIPSGSRALKAAAGLEDGDAVFFVCDQRPAAERLAGLVRTRVGEELGLIEQRATASAGSSTSRCTSGTRRPGRSTSRTTRSRCRRAGSRRWRPRTRSRSWPTSTTSSATASSCQLGRDPQPPPRHHGQGVRDRGLRPRRAGGALRRHVPRAALRRAAAWRDRARHRPHRDAARGHSRTCARSSRSR